VSRLRVRLFGGFNLRWDDCDCESLQSGRARELLCYLLLHRRRSHSREVLASLLWGDRTTAQSKKYFRQTLWQLQQVLHAPLDNAAGSGVTLRTGGESVRLECQPHLWLDTAIFEAAFAPVRGMSGEDIDEQKACSLRRAVDLYRGELLEGWYQDWCLFHRERLRNAYELMLDKLMGYCEARGDFEGGQSYGELLLRQDQARERTYYRLMR